MKKTGTEYFVLTVGWLIAIGLGLLAIYQKVVDLTLNINYNGDGTVVKIYVPNVINPTWFGGAALVIGFCLYGYQTPARGTTWSERAASEWTTTVKILVATATISFICAGILHKRETAISLLVMGILCAMAQFVVSMASALYYNMKRAPAADSQPPANKANKDDPPPDGQQPSGAT